MLTDGTFAQPYDEFPALDFFEQHEGLVRNHDQRSHDRYYLAYEETIYKDLQRDQIGTGVIRYAQLSSAWQDFISSLQTDPGYLSFIHRLLGVDRFTARYAWHVATAGARFHRVLMPQTKRAPTFFTLILRKIGRPSGAGLRWFYLTKTVRD